METPKIMSKEIIAGIREMYTSGDEWDDSGVMVELCDSHEELRRTLIRYGRHLATCAAQDLYGRVWPDIKCTCGFTRATFNKKE